MVARFVVLVMFQWEVHARMQRHDKFHIQCMSMFSTLVSKKIYYS